MRKSVSLMLVAILFAVAGCKKAPPKSADTTPAPPSKVGPAKFDACTLLQTDEVGKVQDAAIKDTVRSGQTNGRIQSAQCYYSADKPNMSVSLAVTLTDPDTKDKDAVREYWKQTFANVEKQGEETEAEKEKRESVEKERRRGEEEEHRATAKRIDGLGEEAYWSGSRIGGAIYALKKNAIVRVSVGGPDDEQHKIEKSKLLAQEALDRLP